MILLIAVAVVVGIVTVLFFTVLSVMIVFDIKTKFLLRKRGVKQEVRKEIFRRLRTRQKFVRQRTKNVQERLKKWHKIRRAEKPNE